MSYSFSAQGATKAEAKAAVEAKFAEVVASQPVHEADRQVMLGTVDAVIDLTRSPTDEEEVRVKVNGYLSWQGPAEDGNFHGARVGVSVNVGKPIA